MAEVDDFTLRQSKRRRVDTGLPRNSYGQTPALSRAVNGNGVTEANQVLRRLLKPSNSQEGVNGDGDRLNGDDYVSASILNKSKHNGDAEESQSQNENSNSYLSSEETQPRDNLNLANKENGEDTPRSQEDDDDDDYMDRSVVNGASKSENKCNENQSGNNEKPEEESVLAKRARVENIVTSMRQSPSQLNSDGKNNQGNETRRQKRKQVAPQPQRVLIQEEKKEGRKEEKRQLKQLLTQLQDHLNKLQHKYFELYDNEETDSEMEDGMENEVLKFNKSGQNGSSKCNNGGSQKDFHAQHSSAKKKKGNVEDKVQSNAEDAIINGGERERFSDALKDQLTSAVTDVVDSVVRKFVTEQHSGSQPPTQEEACNLTVAHENHNQTYIGKISRSSPPTPYSKSSSLPNQDSAYQCEQMEAISLVVPHKNRDRPSRESTPRIESQSHHDFEPPVPATLPTSVAIPNPSLQYSFLPHMAVPISEAPGSIDMSSYNGAVLHGQAAALLSAQADPRHPIHHGLGHRDMTHPQPEGLPLSLLKAEPMLGESSPVNHDYSSMDSSGYNTQNNSCLSTTLTPAHLKKAKLMFFFARYPSSTVLKQHFPDVKFNRHNTAQLIKWFSNFREFYYIQMEKFARQSISEGLKNPEMLQVTRDSELFKVLNLHYNKSNEFEVPEPFLVVARKTLIEFFNAIKAGKDTDASWKKAIYKVISKLDDNLPEFFRSPDCLEELERLER